MKLKYILFCRLPFCRFIRPLCKNKPSYVKEAYCAIKKEIASVLTRIITSLYWCSFQLKNRPKPSYMKRQPDIDHKMRAILVDWLVEVAEEYKLLPQTLYLTINYIDRFLSVMSVLRGKLQLVGTACMLIASKFEEIYPPEVSEFVYITDDTYPAKQVHSHF